MTLRTPILAVALASIALVGCPDETPAPTDSGPDVADVPDGDATSDDVVDVDAADADAGPRDAAADPTTGVACGSETCAVGQYCLVNCLCCGIDTGNPADQRTEYLCVDVPDDCSGDADTCVADEYGCWIDSEMTCSSPCA